MPNIYVSILQTGNVKREKVKYSISGYYLILDTGDLLSSYELMHKSTVGTVGKTHNGCMVLPMNARWGPINKHLFILKSYIRGSTIFSETIHTPM